LREAVTLRNKVVCIDNLISGKVDNIHHLLSHPFFKFSQADISDGIEIQSLDQIYNLACPASPADYQAYPIETVKANVVGSMNLLDLAVKTRARILQASTSEVYGNPLEHPQKETYWGSVNTIGFRSCYN
jgi:UDP-glucuronate decarboxylase